MIGAFRTAQKKLKALEIDLFSFISRIPKTCPLSEHGRVSEKLNKFFLEFDRQLETILPSGFPEDPLYRVAMSYQDWKDAYTPAPEWEGLERKADVYTSATFKASEVLKETYN